MPELLTKWTTLPREAEPSRCSETAGSRRAPRIRLAASATDKADEEAEAQADADSGKGILPMAVPATVAAGIITGRLI